MPILALTSRVHAVTVYRAGALVTRRAELVRPPDGYPERVRLAGLPLALDDGSLKVRLEAAQGGELPIASSVRIALDVPDAGAPVEPPADLEIQEARRVVLALAARREQLALEAEGLARLTPPARPAGKEGEPPPPVPTAARLELLTFRREELERVQAERRAVVDALQQAEEQLAHLEDRRTRAQTARPAREKELRKSAIVELSALAARAERAWLDVEYHVPGARWLPAYALELDRELARGRLSVRALVAQATGEDWAGVALRLSTANAQAWAELPELASVRIGRRQAQGRRRWVPPPTGADELYADLDRAMRPPAPPPPPPAPGAMGGALRDIPAPPRIPSPAQEPLFLDAVAESEGPPTLAGGAVPQSMPQTFGAPRARAAPQAKRVAYEMSAAMSSAPMERSAGSRRPPASPPPPPPPDELRPASEMLAFGNLRLGGPRAPNRGKLAPVGRTDGYLELLAELHVSIAVDVTAAIVAARNEAVRPESASVPARHSAPSALDGFDYAYRAEFPLDVPADGELHGVTLALRDAPAELKHVCVPRESADVFRVVSLANPLEAPLLAGPVDVTVAGEFRLTAQLATVPPRAPFELGLGVEPAIKVARNTRFREETGGLMSSTLSLEHEIAIDVVNHLTSRAQMEVRERLPVTKDGEEQATVTIGAVTPPWAEYRPPGAELKGGHAWHLAVEPGGKARLKAVYTIGIAAKHELAGGNRREA